MEQDESGDRRTTTGRGEAGDTGAGAATSMCLLDGIRQVDRAGDRAKLVHCLSFMDHLPGFAAYKTASIRAMDPRAGDRVLDVACGAGFDIARLAEAVGADGHVFGVDTSATMLGEAQDRAASLKTPTAFSRQDATALAFADGFFDGARIDRSLQHIDDPGRVIAEMARVTRPGGRVVACEPDWGTYRMDHPDGDVTQRIIAHWNGRLTNPRMGDDLRRLFVRHGLDEVTVVRDVLGFTTLRVAEIVFDLTETARMSAADGAVRAAEAEAWLAALHDMSAGGTLRIDLTIVTAVGTRPG